MVWDSYGCGYENVVIVVLKIRPKLVILQLFFIGNQELVYNLFNFY